MCANSLLDFVYDFNAESQLGNLPNLLYDKVISKVDGIWLKYKETPCHIT